MNEQPHQEDLVEIVEENRNVFEAFGTRHLPALDGVTDADARTVAGKAAEN